MPHYAIPFRVQFHDTMAYGTHHFLTNFKFQCAAREEFLFGEVIGSNPQLRAAFDDIVLITQQAYSRNVAPVAVGETVGILMSYEDPTPSSLRFCFRVVRHDGTPVSCGFQTLVCADRKTQLLVSPPAALLRFSEPLLEQLRAPSFSDRVLAGQLRTIFDEQSIALAVAAASELDSRARIVGTALGPAVAKAPVTTGALNDGFRGDSASDSHAGNPRRPLPKLDRGTAFLLPGQGSYYPTLFSDLRLLDPKVQSLFERADRITRKVLGIPFLPLTEHVAPDGQHGLLQQYPDLVQLGIYLGGVVSGRHLLDAGIIPDVIVGHSVGELAALALGGAYSIEAGVEIVCKRIAALAPSAGLGGMCALGCESRRALALIDALGDSTLQTAVINHTTQVVLSGTLADLKRLAELATHLGIPCHRLESRYPFHSEQLRPAVSLFADSLGNTLVGELRIPVYSPLQQALYQQGDRLASILPLHLVRRLEFHDAVDTLHAAGARTFIECGGGDTLSQLVRRILVGKSDARVFPTLRSNDRAGPAIRKVIDLFGGQEKVLPIAIVGMGCALPGSHDPDTLWRNILEGRSGIRDGAELAPEYAAAFLSKAGVVPDKTYTMLGGVVERPTLEQLPPTLRELAARSASVALLSTAVMQCLTGAGLPPDAGRTHFLIGATADGALEHDQAVLVEGLIAKTRELTQSAQAMGELERILRLAGSCLPEDCRRLSSHASINAVAEAFLGPGARVVAVDAACASSLFTIGLAASALRDGECDVALAGGVFSPGPSNSCLFSQFRGLSPTGSRPFDATADGVVFSSGAAVIMCKRLPDAVRDGDSILAVIRGVGTSSDGRCSSVAEPRKNGQVLAIRRAYDQTGVDPETIQYVEAHATSTPVGDAVEFEALTEVFGPAMTGAAPIALGSLKALIGHTGWAAGTASVIKVCEALRAQQLPPQANFNVPNPNINLSASRFELLKSPRLWPRTTQPRRAAVNGFGFGGTNAHLIVEEFDATAAPQWGNRPPRERCTRNSLAVVGVGALFPWTTAPGRFEFSLADIRLPPGRPVLPEVQEHMDRAQFIAIAAADQALRELGEHWKAFRDHTAVVLGVQGKTARSIAATRRICTDFVRMRLNDVHQHSAPACRELQECEAALLESMQDSPPSNAYSLPGLMPNVVAGRVANFFDLHGPNLVIDAGSGSLLEALLISEQMLRLGECKLALAGGIAGSVCAESALITDSYSGGRPLGETGLVLALISLEAAIEAGLPIRKVISFESGAAGIRAGSRAPAYLSGAEGAWEITESIKGSLMSTYSVGWPETCLERNRISIAPFASAAAKPTRLSTYDPIRTAVPRLRRIAPCAADNSPLMSRKVLLLTDRAVPQAVLARLDSTLLCPAGARIAGAIEIDLASEESVENSLAALSGKRFDLILALTDLSAADPDQTLAEGAAGHGLLDLLFVTARRWYGSLQQRQCAIAALTTGSWRGIHLDPYTGLLGGFLKSFSREVPNCLCKAVYSADDAPSALQQLASELSEQALSPIEVAYQHGERHALELIEVAEPAGPSRQLLSREIVVVATGGARGVTAALVEAAVESTGSNVVLLGRTDINSLSPQLRALDNDAFAAHEQEFYRNELARSPGTRLVSLRQRWEALRAAREALTTVEQLRAKGARVEYLRTDVTDQTSVDSAIRKVASDYGRIDLVIHGAGIQASRQLPHKSLQEFRGIIATKLGGVSHLLRACAAHLPGSRIHFHLVTSAFSFFGNDGQTDYGSANQALDRLVASQSAIHGVSRLSSIAWLGWASVGMTRGSEYAALARVRGLRPLARDEGKAFFTNFLSADDSYRNIVQVSNGELQFYKVQLHADTASPTGPPATASETTWRISTSTLSVLHNHCVNGVPTLPGTFELELAVSAARTLRPGHTFVSVEHAVFDRFVKVRDTNESVLRAKTVILEEDDGSTVVEVALHSDFVHRSGRILQKDIRHFSARVRLADRPHRLPANLPSTTVGNAVRTVDPYQAEDSPVRLTGVFRCLQSILLRPDSRTGMFRITEPAALPELASFRTPALLLDAMSRCAVLNVEDDRSMRVWVPVAARRTFLPENTNDMSLHASGKDVLIRATAPRFDGDMVYSDRVEALDCNGRVIVAVEGLAARDAGRVHVGQL